MADLTIKAVLEFLLKGAGLKQAKDQLGGVEQAGKRTEDQLKRTTSTASFLERQFFRIFGGAALLSFGKAAVTEFAKVERGLAAIGSRMEALGISAETHLPRVQQFLEGIERAGGGLLTETIPAFDRFLGITQDVSAAMELTRLSSNVAERGFGTVGSAAQAFVNVIQGRTVGAVNELGLQLRGVNAETATSEQILKAAREQFGGFGEQLEDTADTLDKNAAAWAALKRSAGSVFGEILKIATPTLQFILGGLEVVISGFGALFKTVAAGAVAMQQTLIRTFNFKKLFTEGPAAYYESLKDAGEDAASKVTAAWEEHQAKYNEVLGRGKADTVQSAKDTASAWETILGEARKRQQEADNKANAEQAERDAKAAAARAERARAEAEQLAAERSAFAEKSADELLRAQIEAAQEGSEERLALEIEMLGRLRERALAEARRLRLDEATINAAFDAMEAQRQQAHLDERMEREAQAAEKLRDFMEQIQAEQAELDLEAAEEGSAERLRITQDRIEQERQAEIAKIVELLEAEILAAEARGESTLEMRAALDELIAKADKKAKAKMTKAEKDNAAVAAKIAIDLATKKMGTTAMIAQQAISLGRALFGENKALGIAQAIVDTWIGVNRALADPGGPAGIALAALVAATGLANVAKIASTRPGGGSGSGSSAGPQGFDDPVNDRQARLGGRRWADDLLRHVSSGFNERLGGMTVAPVPSRSAPAGAPARAAEADAGGVSVHIGSFYGGAPGIKRLARQITKAQRRDQRRRIL